MSADKKEWDETLDLLVQGNETVGSELSIGTFVTIKEELFQTMVQEINESRIKNGDLEEGIDLIVVSEDEDTEDDS